MSSVAASGISWLYAPWVDGGAVWNYILGCLHAGGPGCDHCWAETDTGVRARNQNEKLQRANAGLVSLRANGLYRWTGQVNLIAERLDGPLRTGKRRLGIFAPSKSDPFYDGTLDQPGGFEHIAAAWGVMLATPQHTYFVLTKRPDRGVQFFAELRRRSGEHGVGPARYCLDIAAAMLRAQGLEKLALRVEYAPAWSTWPAPNVWVGTSAERQQEYALRSPHLQHMLPDASKVWVSLEPLLGPIDIGIAAAYLDWAVVGGESGNGARPMALADIQSIADQCRDSGIPLFMKQTGTVLAKQLGYRGAGEDPAEWTFDEAMRVRQFPEAA